MSGIRGVAFSMGDSLPLVVRKGLFILLPLAVLILLAIYIYKGKDESLFQKYCLAGILGGGAGNLIDRIFRTEGVVDFLDVRFYGLFGLERWPTFNIADFRCCGLRHSVINLFLEKRAKQWESKK